MPAQERLDKTNRKTFKKPKADAVPPVPPAAAAATPSVLPWGPNELAGPPSARPAASSQSPSGLAALLQTLGRGSGGARGSAEPAGGGEGVSVKAAASTDSQRYREAAAPRQS